MKKILFCVMFILVAGCFLRAEKVTVHDGEVTVERDDGSTVVYKSIRFAEEDGVVIPKEHQPRWYEAAKKTDVECEVEQCVQPLTQKEYKAQVWKNWMQKDMDKVKDALERSLKEAASRAEECAGFLQNSFSYIPVGTFSMGSPAGENGRDSDERQVDVRIATCFLLGKTEVTQAQWKSVMGNNPSRFKGDNLPVENISWSDAVEFCWILTQRERGAGRLPKNWKYTLPTEAQWEYACRSGTKTRFSFGDSDSDLARFGWHKGNSDQETHPVAQKEPNDWGLYDMHGNVWEWCLDYYDSSLSDGVEPVRTKPGSGVYGSRRVNRGGSRSDDAQNCRSAYRNCVSPGGRRDDLGFRVALVRE